MFRIILRFLIITAIALALGFLIYHLNQPATTTSAAAGFNRLPRDLGGDHDLGEGGSGLVSGLLGVSKNLFVVAVLTLVVVSVRRLFMRQPQPARAR